MHKEENSFEVYNYIRSMQMQFRTQMIEIGDPICLHTMRINEVL